jgi:hypothetical protein
LNEINFSALENVREIGGKFLMHCYKLKKIEIGNNEEIKNNYSKTKCEEKEFEIKRLQYS